MNVITEGGSALQRVQADLAVVRRETANVQARRDQEADLYDSSKNLYDQQFAVADGKLKELKWRQRLQKVARYAGPAGAVAMVSAAAAPGNPWMGGVALVGGITTLTAVWAVGFGPLNGAKIEARQDELIARYQALKGLSDLIAVKSKTYYEAEVALQSAQIKLQEKELQMARINESADKVRRMAQQLEALKNTEVAFTEDSLKVGDFVLDIDLG